MAEQSIRMQRIDSQIQKEIAEIINNEVADPALKETLITVNKVQTTADLKECRIYVSAIGKEVKDVVKSLNEMKGFLRSELAKNIRLRTMPSLCFKEDHSYEYDVRMNKLFEDIKVNEKN